MLKINYPEMIIDANLVSEFCSFYSDILITGKYKSIRRACRSFCSKHKLRKKYFDLDKQDYAKFTYNYLYKCWRDSL